MEFRVSIQHWKSQETRVSVKEMTKPTKPNWKIIQGQHQPSFQLLLGYQIICEKLFFKHPGCVSLVLADLNGLKEHQAKKLIEWTNQGQPGKQASRSFGRYNWSTCSWSQNWPQKWFQKRGLFPRPLPNKTPPLKIPPSQPRKVLHWKPCQQITWHGSDIDYCLQNSVNRHESQLQK